MYIFITHFFTEYVIFGNAANLLI
ncbi:stress response small protein YobI [Escherichia coli]